MKFIFPQNYNFENKIFGVIDYSTALANVSWYAFIFIILYIIPISLQFKIFLFILFCFPFFLISITGLNGENLIYVFRYLFKYLINQNYIYMKNNFIKNSLNFLSKKVIICFELYLIIFRKRGIVK